MFRNVLLEGKLFKVFFDTSNKSHEKVLYSASTPRFFWLCCYTRPQKAVKTTTRALHHSTNVFPRSSVKSELIFWLMWHKDITAECLSCHTRQL